MAGLTGLEPATSGVTGRRCNRLYYSPVEALYFEAERNLHYSRMNCNRKKQIF